MIAGALIGLIVGLSSANWQARKITIDSHVCIIALYLLLVVPTVVGLVIGAIISWIS